MKAKLSLLKASPSTSQSSKHFQSKNKGWLLKPSIRMKKKYPMMRKYTSLKTTVESLLVAMTAQNDDLAKWVESFASMAWSVGPRMTRIKNTRAKIQSYIASLKTNTSEIKAMITEIFCAFKGYLIKETPSRTEGEKDDMITEDTVSKTTDVEKEHVQKP
ncbi:hypothetical protein Tco_0045275 [Tanacetum coccineum]